MTEAKEDGTIGGIPCAILDSLMEGCQIIGFDWRYLYVNTAAAMQGRRSAEQLLGRRMTEAYPGIDKTAMFAALRQSMEERSCRQMENEFVFSDKKSGTFELRFIPVPEGVMVLSQETTERRQAEEHILHFNVQLEQLARVVQDLSKARSMEAIADIVRRAARALVGSDGATFVLREGDRCHYVDEDAIAPLWKGQRFPMSACISGWVMLHRQSAVIEDIAVDERIPQDAYRPTFVRSLAMVPIRSADPIGAIGNYWAEPHRASAEDLRILQALADSTSVAMENVQVYKQLEESEQQYRELVENLEDVVFCLDAAGNIIYMSPAVRKYGYAPRELLGRHFTQFVHQEDQKTLLADFSRAMEGTVVGCEFRGIGKDGAVYFLRTTVRATFENGRPVGLKGVLIDLTEQRHAEEQLRLSQRLESVGRLAGGVAHDFNNLLTVIKSYTGFALESLDEKDPLYADIQEIRQAGDRAVSLTRQLLAFSRKQVMQPKVIDLNQIVADIDKMLRRLIGEDIDLATRLAEQLDLVRVDPGQIEQVIMNLAVNARDAMPDGGCLAIETANVELDEAYADQHSDMKPGPYVMLAITDTGSGMDKETRERIFEPFFTTKEAGKGTGLGLAMVYGIVKQSGGYIWVYSEPGQGTTFKIYLPRREGETEVERLPQSEVIRAAAHQTILVVEDEEAVRKIAERVLTAAGYSVLTAANGEEALATCEHYAGEIDLIITDLVMPRMSGRELVERLAVIRPTAAVLYMSGYTDNAIAHHGVLDPGTYFLAKPFSAVDLTRKVDEVLEAGQRDAKLEDDSWRRE